MNLSLPIGVLGVLAKMALLLNLGVLGVFREKLANDLLLTDSSAMLNDEKECKRL